MTFDVYVGRAPGGRTRVHSLEWPGLVSVEASRDGALARMPLAFSRYAGWCEFHRGDGPSTSGKVNLSIAGEAEVPEGADGCDAIATFRPDLAPLDDGYLERCVARVAWACEDLLELAEGLIPEKLAWVPPGQAHSLEEELRRAGRGWDWLLTRLEVSAPEASAADGPAFATGGPASAALRLGRERLERELRALPAGARSAEFSPGSPAPGLAGERWTARKVARRAVEHALEHLVRLYSYLSLGSGEAS